MPNEYFHHRGSTLGWRTAVDRRLGRRYFLSPPLEWELERTVKVGGGLRRARALERVPVAAVDVSFMGAQLSVPASVTPPGVGRRIDLVWGEERGRAWMSHCTTTLNPGRVLWGVALTLPPDELTRAVHAYIAATFEDDPDPAA